MNSYHTDYIYHWGIKGQRWGIRRYQNEDGSLTPAGKKRYSPTEEDERLYGKKGAQRIADSRNNGSTHKKARSKENRRQLLQGTAVLAGIATVSYLMSSGKGSALVNAGKKLINNYNNVQVLDKAGNVISKYHSKINIGKNVINALIKV